MSLLNDMLRDLAQQPKVTAVPVAHPQDVLQEATLLKKIPFNWLPSAIIFVVVFVSVLGFEFFSKSSEFEFHFFAEPVQQLPSVESANAEAAAAAVASSNLEEEQLQSQIAELLVQANRALAMGKLTSPAEDNAYGYFQKISALSPNYPQVKVGLELISARYLEKAREQLSLNNRTQAEVFIRRAKFVSPEYFRKHSDLVSAEKTVPINPSPADAPTSVTQNVSGALLNNSQSETIKPFVVAEDTSSNIVPNESRKDQQLASQANELMRQGKKSEAMEILKNFIVAEKKPIESTVLLADIYYQQGNQQALEILLKNSSFLPSVPRAKLQAELFVLRGDEMAAIAELEQQLTNADNDEQYRALLASLYHKAGQYHQSEVSYQRLLKINSENPAYWLGLGLAFDGLAEHKNALQVYKHLKEFPQLQEPVRNYIDQRIAALDKE